MTKKELDNNELAKVTGGNVDVDELNQKAAYEANFIKEVNGAQNAGDTNLKGATTDRPDRGNGVIMVP